MMDEPLEPIEADDSDAVDDTGNLDDYCDGTVSFAEEVGPSSTLVPDDTEKEFVSFSEWNDTVVPIMQEVGDTFASLAESEHLRHARAEHERLAHGAGMDDLKDDAVFMTPYLAGPGCYVDGTGVYQRALPGTAKDQRYGKTDEALEEGESVTISLWSYDADEEEWVDSDEDQEDVYDSFWYRGLTIAA